MRPRTIIGFALGSLLLAVAALFAMNEREVRREEAIGRDTDAKAAALKAAIDANLSVGSSSQADVQRFLQSHGWSSAPDSSDERFVTVGEKPSGVWWCGPVTVGVLFKFGNGYLTETSVASRALSCL